MNCVNCGAALPPKSAVCSFCGTLNDVDLRGCAHPATGAPGTTSRLAGPGTPPNRRAGESGRACPRCGEQLATVELRLDGRLKLDRCPQCLGLFFDSGELEELVNTRSGGLAPTDLKRISALLREETPDADFPVHYVNCPVCGEAMNRRVYGARSGVIFDECRLHGVWLDGGELRRIVAWVRAGGPELNEKRAAERRRVAERSRKLDRALAGSRPDDGRPTRSPWDTHIEELFRLLVDIL